ncbi:amino acid ABC transporter substrate-binding protein [Anaerolineae bacterium CFX8]|nr:amino acid ABC transporter substrate-binding protein [Anaerolineae bacterium CFX8]
MKIFGLLMLFLVLFRFAAAQDSPAECSPAADSPLRIGAVFPPESLFSVEAADPYRGAAAMIETLNACGGVNGRPVELVYRAAANHNQALAAVEALRDDVPLVIGSGSPVISDVLLEASRDGAFVYWEVTEPLDTPHEYAFSLRPSSAAFGRLAADFVNDFAAGLPEGEQLRAAVIYENRPRASAAAGELIVSLNADPLFTRRYNNTLTGTYDLAVQMRERGINTVILVGFEDDADGLWYDMREADANLRAWIHVGGEAYRRNTCDRLGNTDSLIAISAAGPASETYRYGALGVLYEQYLQVYRQRFEREPGERANQGASGVYLLLRYAAPVVDFSADGFRAAILAAAAPAPAGLMGEEVLFAAGANTEAAVIVTQRQNGRFCTIYPAALATCSDSLLPFPTWRERALIEERTTCQN